MATKEDIVELYTFLEVDMPSKVIPEEIIEGEVWTREDMFHSVEQVRAYLKEHFELAFPKIFSSNVHNTNNKGDLE